MKRIKHLKASQKTKEEDQINSKSYCQGVTQSLIDKYKPSKNFAVINVKNLKDKETKAA